MTEPSLADLLEAMAPDLRPFHQHHVMQAAAELRRLEGEIAKRDGVRQWMLDDAARLEAENARLREALENILTACGEGAVWAIAQCAQAALAPAKGGEEMKR